MSDLVVCRRVLAGLGVSGQVTSRRVHAGVPTPARAARRCHTSSSASVGAASPPTRRQRDDNNAGRMVRMSLAAAGTVAYGPCAPDRTPRTSAWSARPSVVPSPRCVRRSVRRAARRVKRRRHHGSWRPRRRRRSGGSPSRRRYSAASSARTSAETPSGWRFAQSRRERGRSMWMST